MTASDEYRKKLQRTPKAELIQLCRAGIPNPRGGRTQIFGAHSLEKWTKEELVNVILDVMFPPPGLVELPLEGLS